MILDATLLPWFIGAVFLLMITPGPDMTFVIANSLGGGRRAGVASLLGVATGAYLHIIAAAFGLSAIFQTSEFAFNALRYAGAAYLLYLGIKFLRSHGAALPIRAAVKRHLFRTYMHGVMTNLLNPKAAIFTLSFVPQFVVPELGSVLAQTLVLGLIIVVVMILVDLPIVLASSRIAQVWARHDQTPNWPVRLTGILLIGFAAFFAAYQKPT